MDLSILREFHLLSQNLSYSATAKRLFISQSVLSKHIQSLERELDTRLFVRDSHSVRLTATGRLFAEKVEGVLECYDDACRAVAELEDEIGSSLSIGFTPDTTRHFFTGACERFRLLAPHVKLAIFPMEAEAVVDALRAGKIDLGITLFLMDAVPENMNFRILEHERFGILANAKHRLAKRSSVSMADLEGERVLVPSPTAYPTMARETSSRLSQAAPGVTLVEEMTGLGSMGPLLKMNDIVALTYGCTARFYTDDFSFAPVEDIDIKAVTGVLWKVSRENRNIDPFIDCLVESVGECLDLTTG